jgi:small ubiquitin-related modifier
MEDSSGDVKPKLEQGGDDGTLSIKVRDQQQGEIVFKVKRTTKFKRVLDAFCNKKGWQTNQVRFHFDGQRVDEEMTPEELGMESNDCIDAMMEQIGGC